MKYALVAHVDHSNYFIANFLLLFSGQNGSRIPLISGDQFFDE